MKPRWVMYCEIDGATLEALAMASDELMEILLIDEESSVPLEVLIEAIRRYVRRKDFENFLG